MYGKKFLPKLVIASVLVGGVNFVPETVNFNADNLQIISVAYAEVQTVTASGKAILSFGENDAQIVNTAKEVAKLNAIQSAKENAGVYIKSFSKTVNGVLTDDDISTYTSNNITILDVTYKKIPVQAHDVKGNDTGEIAFMYEATVTAKIDTSGLNGYIKGDAKTKAEFIEKNKISQNDVSQINKNFENLNNEAKNKTTEQIEIEIQKIDNQISVRQKIDEANKIASQGWQLWEKKDYQNAILKFNEAIKLRPNYYHFYEQRGHVYDDLKNYQQAVDDYTTSIDLHEKYLNSLDSINSTRIGLLNSTYQSRADIYYFYLKNYDKAISDHTKIIELYQKEIDLCTQESLKKSTPEDKKHYEKMKKYTIEFMASTYVLRGNDYAKLKNYEQAIEDYNQAIQLKDKYAKEKLKDLQEKLKKGQ